MIPRKRPWTDEDNERLKNFVARDMSIFLAAASLKRSVENIRVQARKLGTPFSSISAFRKKFVVREPHLDAD
jgi:hypothetical protein